MTESLVEMASRHVREGKERIARHRELLDQLARDGHADAWLAAAEFMEKLEAWQAEAEDHLAMAIKLEARKARLALTKVKLNEMTLH